MSRARVVRLYENEDGSIDWPATRVPDGVVLEVYVTDMHYSRVYDAAGMHIVTGGLSE